MFYHIQSRHISIYVVYSIVIVSFMPVDIVYVNVTFYGHVIFPVAK